MTGCGVPTRKASIFELLSCRKLAVIHYLISSKQLESVARAADGVEFLLI